MGVFLAYWSRDDAPIKLLKNVTREARTIEGMGALGTSAVARTYVAESLVDDVLNK